MHSYSAVCVLYNKVIWRPLNRNSMHMHEKSGKHHHFLVPYMSRQMKRFVSNAEYDEEEEEICMRKENLF